VLACISVLHKADRLVSTKDGGPLRLQLMSRQPKQKML